MKVGREIKGKNKKEIKNCKACGLPFENRKSWKSRGIWDEIVYCSKRCRNKK